MSMPNLGAVGNQVVVALNQFAGQQVQPPAILQMQQVVSRAMLSLQEPPLEQGMKNRPQSGFSTFLNILTYNLEALQRVRDQGDAVCMPEDMVRTAWKLASQISIGSTEIGRGSFGIVVVDQYPDGTALVRKISRGKDLQVHRNELKTFYTMPPSPFIVPFFGQNLNGEILLAHLEGGDLWTFVDAVYQTQPSPTQRRVIAEDILSGVAYLHELRIVHRDLKLENVLLDGRQRAKITDFGFAVQLSPEQMTNPPRQRVVGAWMYLAPEYCQTPNEIIPDLEDLIAPLSVKGDLWGCGVMIAALVSGQLLLQHFMKFTGEHRDPEYDELCNMFRGYPPEMQEKIYREGVRDEIEELRIRWRHAPQESPAIDRLAEMMEACLVINPGARSGSKRFALHQHLQEEFPEPEACNCVCM